MRQKFNKQAALLTILSTSLLMIFGTANAQLANDTCEGAIVIPGSAPDPVYTDVTDSSTANPDLANVPPLTCNIPGLGDGENTIWYEWTPDASGAVNISTIPSFTSDGLGDLDTAHGMYVGACDALVEVACVDIGLNDDLLVDVEAGTTYRIKVGEFAGGLSQDTDGGFVSVTVEPSPYPAQFILESARHNESAPMRDVIAAAAAAAAGNGGSSGNSGNRVDYYYEIPNAMGDEIMKAEPGTVGNHPAHGSKVAGAKDPMQGPPIVQHVIEGGKNDDNAFLLRTLIAPPDTIGDVGKNHYVQMYNLLTLIFDKDGNTVLGPFPTNAFFTGLGGQCEFTNSGDPIVLYDEETDRWLVSQFASGFPQDGLCVAVSTSGDPTGSYHQYEFDFTGIGFPDYPKFGFASDSISVMANMFSPFAGTGLGVIDKKEAMQSGPATMVFFILGPSEFGFIPGDNDGPDFDNVPPTFFTNNFFSGEVIDVWEIDPDFEHPENSTIAEVANVSVTPFDTQLCTASRGRCIAQPGSGTGDPATGQNIQFLEGIADRMMHRAQMRAYDKGKGKKSKKSKKSKKGKGEIRAIMSHTVDADGNGNAGVRWYEMRNKKDKGWKLERENTFSPDGDNRWMGSIAMTEKGDACLGYSISSFTTFPSIGVTGRIGKGNSMNVEEAVVFDGNTTGNVQRQTARWGDYSSMNIDPVDGSCWYTTEYALPNSFIGERFGWGTKIVNYKLKKDKKGKKAK